MGYTHDATNIVTLSQFSQPGKEKSGDMGRLLFLLVIVIGFGSITEETTAMKTHAKATFTVNDWGEKPYNEIKGGPKLTRASVNKSYEGDIKGEGKLEYLMMHREDGSASFLGLERVVGSVGGRTGSFVFQHSGTFKNGVATVTLVVVSDSGTGDLRGLRGQGTFVVGHQGPYSMTLEYEFK